MLNSFKALAAELFVFKKKKACLIICKNKELGIENVYSGVLLCFMSSHFL